MDRATKALDLQEEVGTDEGTHKTRKIFRTQANEIDHNTYDSFLVDKITRHLTENGDVKYVVQRCWHDTEEDTVEPTHPLATAFFVPISDNDQQSYTSKTSQRMVSQYAV